MKKISESELAKFGNISTRTLRRWKVGQKKYDQLMKKYKEEEISSLRNLLKKHSIELMGNFGIYFTDIKDYAVGILAEDTNSIIRKEEKTVEELLEIEKNLKLLREWL